MGTGSLVQQQQEEEEEEEKEEEQQQQQKQQQQAPLYKYTSRRRQQQAQQGSARVEAATGGASHVKGLEDRAGRARPEPLDLQEGFWRAPPAAAPV